MELEDKVDIILIPSTLVMKNAFVESDRVIKPTRKMNLQKGIYNKELLLNFIKDNENVSSGESTRSSKFHDSSILSNVNTYQTKVLYYKKEGYKD